MDGTKTFAGDTKMSASAQRASVRWRPEKALQYSPNALNFGENAFRASSDELLPLNSRCGGGLQTFPRLSSNARWTCHSTDQIAKRSELHTFKVMPKRSIVERSFALLDKNRRLCENCERWFYTSLQFVHLAFLDMLLKKTLNTF